MKNRFSVSTHLERENFITILFELIQKKEKLVWWSIAACILCILARNRKSLIIKWVEQICGKYIRNYTIIKVWLNYFPKMDLINFLFRAKQVNCNRSRKTMAIGSSFYFLSFSYHFFGFLFHRTFCMHRQIHHLLLLDLLKSRAYINFFIFSLSFLLSLPTSHANFARVPIACNFDGKEFENWWKFVETSDYQNWSQNYIFRR